MHTENKENLSLTTFFSNTVYRHKTYHKIDGLKENKLEQRQFKGNFLRFKEFFANDLENINLFISGVFNFAQAEFSTSNNYYYDIEISSLLTDEHSYPVSNFLENLYFVYPYFYEDKFLSRVETRINSVVQILEELFSEPQIVFFSSYFHHSLKIEFTLRKGSNGEVVYVLGHVEINTSFHIEKIFWSYERQQKQLARKWYAHVLYGNYWI